MDWISVKDRLPEVWVTVLLWDGHHMVSGYLADDGIIVESWWCSAFPATHWMMPEPPKEEREMKPECGFTSSRGQEPPGGEDEK